MDRPLDTQRKISAFERSASRPPFQRADKSAVTFGVLLALRCMDYFEQSSFFDTVEQGPAAEQREVQFADSLGQQPIALRSLRERCDSTPFRPPAGCDGSSDWRQSLGWRLRCCIPFW